jgi:hypothetical protein
MKEALTEVFEMANTVRKEKRGFMHDYGLTVTLAALFLVSWLAQGIFQWFNEAQEAATHGQGLNWSDFIAAFGMSTFENWQSEFLQLLTFVVLTSFLFHKGSPESRDGNDQMAEALLRIEKRLDKIGAQLDDAQDREDMKQFEREVEQGKEMRTVAAGNGKH